MMHPGFNALASSAGRWDAKLTEQLLLVEADPGLRESRRLLFSTLGVRVTAMCSALEVFRLPREIRYSLLVLDVVRDPEHASELAAFARTSWPEAKILVLGTGRGAMEERLYDGMVDPAGNPAGVVRSAQSLLEHVRAERMV